MQVYPSYMRLLLPKRSVLILTTYNKSLPIWERVIAYKCLDCDYHTPEPVTMLIHQKQWHPFYTWLRRWRHS